MSSLTPAQLATKRAKDRKAQRACQKRKREAIECLERDIEELRNENQALKKELGMLKTSIRLFVNEPPSSMQPGNSCLCIAHRATHLADKLMFLQISIFTRPSYLGKTSDWLAL